MLRLSLTVACFNKPSYQLPVAWLRITDNLSKRTAVAASAVTAAFSPMLFTFSTYTPDLPIIGVVTLVLFAGLKAARAHVY